MQETSIAAISTPAGQGGIAVIRISGAEAKQIAGKVFRSLSGKPLQQAKGYTAMLGKVYDGDMQLDEAIATVFCAPKSYTGEDVVELSCHGGSYVAKRVLRAVLAAGAQPAGPGEFTKRAFLNGKMDLTRAEAVADIISASGERALQAAVSCHKGAAFAKITSIKEELLAAAASVAVFSDYPDEDIEFSGVDALSQRLQQALQQLQALLAAYDSGKVFKDGLKTAIVGRPNAGKSTLMNLLSGEEVSIVTPIAGTTRDVIEETVMLGDIKLCLADTAGLRDTTDTVERIGVERSRQKMQAAALVLAVFDSSDLLTDEDMALLQAIDPKKTVAVLNKSDLGQRINTAAFQAQGIPFVVVSAKSGAGLAQLKQAVEQAAGLTQNTAGDELLANERQRNCALRGADCVAEAIEVLNSGFTLDAVGVLIDDALNALMELTGERASNEVAEEIFRTFCVGK